MSWVDNIQGIDLVITTGNGVAHTVQYFTSTVTRNMDFNVSEFVFKGKIGTLVKRGTPRGKRYDISFMFTGENCVKDANKFAKDAEDNRAWKITHPFYGGLVVQPISITFDNSVLNVSKITGTVVETILNGSAPRVVDIANASALVNTAIGADIASSVPTFTTGNLSTLSNTNTTLYDQVKAKINTVQANIDYYTNKYNTAMAFLNPLLYSVLDIALSTQSLIFAPAYFVMDVNSKVLIFEDSLSMLSDMVTDILNLYNIPTKSSKCVYEMYGATAITGMCLSSTTNTGEAYTYRPDVINVINRVITAYNGYINNLDLLQSDYGGNVDSYIPNPNGITKLNNLVHTTISLLMTIANNAKQERVFYTTEPTNSISLTHKLYGMSLDDSTLDLFMKSNAIGITEMLNIKVGRKITYYI